MRLIQNYVFKIGTKIAFSEWPEIIHRFLAENHLVHHRFLYYFDHILGRDETGEEDLQKCSCAKILKDCPSLGKIRYDNGKAHGRYDVLWLSNIDRQESFPEENILPLMKKIHRRYGFSESNLYYFDIDFFGRKTCFERDYSEAARKSKRDNVPFDPALCMEDQPYGSGITLHRDVCGENYLKLSVDLLHDGAVLDATPYYESMQRLLPKIKSDTFIKIYLTEEEQKKIDETNLKAEPMLQQCCAFFSERLPFTDSQNAFSSNYSVAKPLKKLAKQYGYAYKLVWNGGVYSLEKRTEKGNVILISVFCGPSHYDMGMFVSYQGVGFNHVIGNSTQTPTDQQEADSALEKILSVVADFENTMLSSLDCLFPETPSWFIPEA